MAQHSKVGASSMYRWQSCAGSVKMCEGIESVTSAYAAEGTLAHDIAAKLISGDRPSVPEDFEGMDAVKVYVDFALELKELSQEFKVEHRFDLSLLHPGLFGTADLVALQNSTLYVVDLKFGKGIPVEVFEDGKPNRQLMYYALGALVDLKFKVDEVELVIVQPRCYHPDGPIRSVRIHAVDLIEFANELVDAAIATEDPNAKLNPGDHCRFCPAAAAKCPALRQKSLEVAQREFSPTFSYDPKELSDTLDKLPGLEAFIKSVREFAYREAEHGRIPPGYKLVQKRATRRWKDSDESTAAKLSKFANKEDLFDFKLKSPAQVEKLVGKTAKKEIESLVIAESSGFTLVHDSDSRPSIANDAAAVFKTIENEQTT